MYVEKKREGKKKVEREQVGKNDVSCSISIIYEYSVQNYAGHLDYTQEGFYQLMDICPYDFLNIEPYKDNMKCNQFLLCRDW